MLKIYRLLPANPAAKRIGKIPLVPVKGNIPATSKTDEDSQDYCIYSFIRYHAIHSENALLTSMAKQVFDIVFTRVCAKKKAALTVLVLKPL